MTTRARTAKALFVAAALAACALLLWPAETLAQCALCRSAAEAAGAETARAINLGILVLLVPPVAIFCAIFAVAVRQQKEEGGEPRD